MLSTTADQWDLHVGGDDDDLSICGQIQLGVSVEYCSPTLIIITVTEQEEALIRDSVRVWGGWHRYECTRRFECTDELGQGTRQSIHSSDNINCL